MVSNWRWSGKKSEIKDEKSILGVWLVFTKSISKKKSSAKCYLLTKMKIGVALHLHKFLWSVFLLWPVLCDWCNIKSDPYFPIVMLIICWHPTFPTSSSCHRTSHSMSHALFLDFQFRFIFFSFSPIVTLTVFQSLLSSTVCQGSKELKYYRCSGWDQVLPEGLFRVPYSPSLQGGWYCYWWK